MNTEEFIKLLGKAQDLMGEEKYRESLDILYTLKKIEQQGDFDYSLTHKLYQLISNSESLLNQSSILKELKNISNKHESISFDTLSKLLKEDYNITLETGILRREIELLILRNKIPHRIEKDKLIFS
ncbi:MAG: hypothetical protein BAJALOKI3v1_420024 [Promethearchaeota archaeon]|jgi:hypothetical protein|nr:MAG: hypothetical protein BAJALOKI3v1_420024 [Candidatus Lokiarchaeota archaeon]